MLCAKENNDYLIEIRNLQPNLEREKWKETPVWFLLEDRDPENPKPVLVVCSKSEEVVVHSNNSNIN